MTDIPDNPLDLTDEAANALDWTDEQEAIFQAAVETDDHLQVNAGAGSGKTTVILELVNRLVESGIHPSNIQVCAFNRSIDQEITAELQEMGHDDVWCNTLHSLGLSNFGREYDFDVDDRGEKVQDILFSTFRREEIKDIGYGELQDLISKVRFEMADPHDREQVMSLIRAYGIDLGMKDLVLDQFGDILDRIWEDTSLLTFDGMLDMPLRHDLWLYQKDVVLVDELQDLSEAGQRLVLGSCQNGQIIGVGDVNQAIYGFRGAHHDGMQKFKNKLESWHGDTVRELPLTVTFRCPEKVVDVANVLVPDYEAADGTEEGTVREVSRMKGLEEAQPGDMILCRTNAPLASAALDLISMEKPAYINGRAIGENLKELVTEHADGAENLDECMDSLRSWKQRKVQDALDSGNENLASKVRDRVLCVRTLAQKVDTARELVRLIDRIFDEPEGNDGVPSNVIFLSTVHRAKGLEAPTVYILEPSEFEFHGQEGNITYVALTRAEEELVFLGPAPPRLAHKIREEPDMHPQQAPTAVTESEEPYTGDAL